MPARGNQEALGGQLRGKIGQQRIGLARGQARKPPQRPQNPLFHLARRVVGERNGQNAFEVACILRAQRQLQVFLGELVGFAGASRGGGGDAEGGGYGVGCLFVFFFMGS